MIQSLIKNSTMPSAIIKYNGTTIEVISSNLLFNQLDYRDYTATTYEQDGITYSVSKTIVEENTYFLQFIVQTNDTNLLKKYNLLKSQINSLIDHLPFNVWMKDLSGKYIMVNKNYADFVDLPITEIISKTDFDIYNKEYGEKFYQEAQSVIKNKTKYILEEQFKNKRKFKWLEKYIAPISNENQEVIGTIGVTRDITQRKTIELAIKRGNDKMSNILDNLDVIIFKIDETGRLLFVEGRALDLIQMDSGQLVGISIFDDYDFHKQDVLLNGFESAIRGNIVKLEMCVNQITFECIFSPFVESDGMISGVIGIAIDITDRKYYENAVNAQKNMIQHLIQYAPKENSIKDQVLHLNEQFLSRFNKEIELKTLSDSDLEL